jgi:hypothetical protein
MGYVEETGRHGLLIGRLDDRDQVIETLCLVEPLVPTAMRTTWQALYGMAHCHSRCS